MVHQLEGTATSTHLGVVIMLPGVPESTSKRRQNWRVVEDIQDKVYKLLEWERIKLLAAGKPQPWWGRTRFSVVVRQGLGRGNFLIVVSEDRVTGKSGNIVW